MHFDCLLGRVLIEGKISLVVGGFRYSSNTRSYVRRPLTVAFRTVDSMIAPACEFRGEINCSIFLARSVRIWVVTWTNSLLHTVFNIRVLYFVWLLIHGRPSHRNGLITGANRWKCLSLWTPWRLRCFHIKLGWLFSILLSGVGLCVQFGVF